MPTIKRYWTPASRLPNSRKPLWKVVMYVIASGLVLLCLTSCASQEVTPTPPAKIINSCRYKVVTYGDALSCLIELDEAQYQ